MGHSRLQAALSCRCRTFRLLFVPSPSDTEASGGSGATRILRLQACNGKVGVSENPGIPFAGARMRYERLLDAGWRLGALCSFCGFFVAVGRMHFRPHRKGFQTQKKRRTQMNLNRSLRVPNRCSCPFRLLCRRLFRSPAWLRNGLSAYTSPRTTNILTRTRFRSRPDASHSDNENGNIFNGIRDTGSVSLAGKDEVQ